MGVSEVKATLCSYMDKHFTALFQLILKWILFLLKWPYLKIHKFQAYGIQINKKIYILYLN